MLSALGVAIASAFGCEVLAGIFASPALKAGIVGAKVARRVIKKVPPNHRMNYFRKEAKRRGGAYQSVVEDWFP